MFEYAGAQVRRADQDIQRCFQWHQQLRPRGLEGNTVLTRKVNSKQTGESGANSVADLLTLYEVMLLIRHAEQNLATLFANGEIPGFIHLSIGQEAVSAGVMSALRDEDTIASTHRGHGHALAKGMDLTGFFLELLGKEEGLCRGRGGSMHVAQASIGMLGANGIVGAGIPIAMGSALALKRRKCNSVAVAFFGDGAVAEGVLHETLNMAALWQLPLLFLCESNGWSEFSPVDRQIAASLDKLANTFGIPFTSVDGNDVYQVANVAAAIVGDIRRGGGPQFLECKTTRVRGHFEGDAQKYRPAVQLADLESSDPIRRAREVLFEAGGSEAEINGVDARVIQRVAEAIEQARKGTDPDFEAAVLDVYAKSSAL